MNIRLFINENFLINEMSVIYDGVIWKDNQIIHYTLKSSNFFPKSLIETPRFDIGRRFAKLLLFSKHLFFIGYGLRAAFQLRKKV